MHVLSRSVVPAVAALLLGTALPASADEAPASSATSSAAPTQAPSPSQPTTAGPTTAAPTSLGVDARSVAGAVGDRVDIGGTVSGRQPGQTVRLQQRSSDGRWRTVGWADVEGERWSAPVVLHSSPRTYRAAVRDGDEVVATSQAVEADGEQLDASVVLTTPSGAKDYSRITIKTRVYGEDHRRVTGQVSIEWAPTGASSYTPLRTFTLNDDAAVTYVRNAPRYDGRFRVRYLGSARYAKAVSTSRGFDNQPPGARVTIPSSAPNRTVALAPQDRAEQAAPQVYISRISSSRWASMKGRSWHSGCPVGRDSLREIRVNYWAFDGYVRRGSIIVNKSVATRTANVFTSLFNRRVPIRAMHPVDRFGWSDALRGANDYQSMRADNTSAFNCRRVVGSTSTVSPHSYGTSIDINPWENPYRSASGYRPNSAWVGRTTPSAVVWRSSGHQVVRVFKAQGFRWLGSADLHHFQR